MVFSRNRVLQSWPFWLVLISGITLITFTITGFDLSLYPGDFGDGRFNAYILEHCHRFFTGRESSFWDAPFMYPEPSVISYSDNLVGTAPLYSLLRFCGLDVFTAFQGWFVLLSIGNFVACYAFLKYLFKNPYAAALGAFVFAFSLSLHSQLTHAQTFPRLFIPLAIWMLLLYRKDLAPKYLFLALLFLVWQFYAGIYLGFLLSIPFFLLLAWILIENRILLRSLLRKRMWVVYSICSVVVHAGLLLLLMVPYIQRSQGQVGTPYADIVGTLPTIRSYFCSKSGTFCWDGLTDVCKIYGAHWDHQLFPGLLSLLAALILFIAMFFYRKRLVLPENLRIIWVLAAVGLITGLLVFRVGSHSLYYFIYHLPGFSSMRSMGRIINVQLLFFAVAMAFSVFLLQRKWPKISIMSFVVLLGLLLGDNYLDQNAAYSVYKADIYQRSEAMKDLLKDVPSGGIISYEPADENVPVYFHQLDAMLAAQALDLIAINAYTATSPGTYTDYWWNPNPETRQKWLQSVPVKMDTVYVFPTSIGITPKFGK